MSLLSYIALRREIEAPGDSGARLRLRGKVRTTRQRDQCKFFIHDSSPSF